jgi:hypothetical protein
MPQIGFYCPNGQSVLFNDCLKKCHMKERCVSTPTLRALCKQRIWTGKPSTTQLLGGTRYALLKILKDYYEDIQSLAWILLGNKVHKSLEDNDVEGTAEIEFKDKSQTGIADYYEACDKTLWDYKTSGSFKVHKALGMQSRKINDPNGERYKRSGKGYKAGDIKKITVWDKNGAIADKWEWILQTNRYAIWLKDDNRPVEKIKIEVIVRDGGLKAAAMHGIDRNIIIINIPILNKEYVLDYFKRKASMLRLAIASSWAPKCNSKECWDGRKCEGYCPVSKYCEEMTNEHKLKERFGKMEPEILC